MDVQKLKGMIAEIAKEELAENREMKKLYKDISRIEKEIEKLKKERKDKFGGSYAKKVNNEKDPEKRKSLLKPIKKISQEISALQDKLSELRKKESQYIDSLTSSGKDDDLYIEGVDIEVGHDDEPEMIQGTVYEIGKYAIELYKMLEAFKKTGKEIDFPHWWQAKVVKSREFISSATHYLENETRDSEI